MKNTMAENMTGDIISDHRERMLNLKKYYPFFRLIDTSFSNFKDGRYEILDSMPPYQFGGDMVDTVSYQHTTFEEPPARFEAGTPAIVQAVGLGRALQYMSDLGMDNIEAHEVELVKYTNERLKEVKGLKVIGNAENKGGVFSFNVEGIHPQDLAFILDKEGVSVRTGHHCAEPLVHRMGFESVARASLGLYSTEEDIDNFVKALNKAVTFF